MDQNVKEMLKFIEEDGLVLAKKAKSCKETRPDLVSQIDEFNGMYRSLAERYHHLAQELQTCNKEYDYAPDSTPDQKLSKNTHSSVSSHVDSSDVSVKEGSESSSLSDSESESFNSGNAYFTCQMSNDGKPHKVLDLSFQPPDMGERLMMEAEDGLCGRFEVKETASYKELLGNFISCEEKLKLSKTKLQLSEDEVTGLRRELEKSESLAAVSQKRLELAEREIQMMETYLEEEKSRVWRLQKQIDEGMPALQDQVKSAEVEITALQGKLDLETKHVADLQERIIHYENKLSDQNNEIGELKAALLNAEEESLLDKSDLHSDIYCLKNTQRMLEEKLRECELQCKSFEEKLRQCEAEKVEMKDLHDTLASALVREINQLKEELVHRKEHVETLNKSLDNHKLKFDMLVAEKDGIIAKVNTLTAEIKCRDIQIEQMEVQIRQMQLQSAVLIAGSESSQKLVEDLRLRAQELEEEVGRQKDEIAVGAEEKREAIRQLCYSLDHYKSGYKELCRALTAHRRPTVMAS